MLLALRNLVTRYRACLSSTGLSVKMALIVIASIVLLVSAFEYVGTRALEHSTQRTLQERIALAQTTAQYLDSLLSLIEHLLTESAKQEVWHDPPQRDLALERLYRLLNPFATRVCLLDPNVRVIAMYPPLTNSPSFEQFASVSAVLNGQSFAVSRYARPLLPGDSAAIAAVPIRDSQQRVVYALLLTLRLSSAPVLFNLPIEWGNTGSVDVIDAGGTILASTRAERIGEPSNYASSLNRWLSDHRPTTATLQTELVAFAPLEHAQWGVTVRQSQAEVFEVTRLVQARLVLLGVLAMGWGLLLTLGFQRTVLAPIHTLTLAARRIASGNWSAALPTHAPNEIGDLVRAFAALRAHWQEATQENQAEHRELVARAQARAAECEAARAEIESLYLELRHKENLRRALLHRVIAAQEEERRRLARELHDTTIQALVGMVYRLEHANEMLARGKLRPAETREVLKKLLESVQTARDEVNRVIWDLRPLLLDQLGLVPAIRYYAETRLSESEVQWNIRINGEPRHLAPALEVALFRVAQEAINNIARHAQARNVGLVFEYTAQRLRICIRDDGIGFDPTHFDFSRNGTRGLGLLSMEERMKLVGGELELHSTPGAGTTITLSVPIEE